MGILIEVASMKNIIYPQLVTSTLVLSPNSNKVFGAVSQMDLSSS